MERSTRRAAQESRGGGEGAALPLPPPPPSLAATSSPSSSIRAHLARTVSGNASDCQSPRSLLSRILQRGGDSGGGFGCRVRLPRYCSKDRKEQEAAVKVVEPAAEPPADTPRSSLEKKKPEEELLTMNLGLGASLVLMLSKSAAELNKMVALRAQMETLVLEIRKGNQRKNSASSSQESTTTTDVNDSIVRASNDGGNVGGHAVVMMDQMEAELEVELKRLQSTEVLEAKNKDDFSDSPSASCVDDDGDGVKDDEVIESDAEKEEEEEEEEEGEDKSPPHGGVSARELERRLHELLQKRQQERIVELETALEHAQRKLQDKEREMRRWRDTAKLVSHRRNDPHLVR